MRAAFGLGARTLEGFGATVDNRGKLPVAAGPHLAARMRGRAPALTVLATVAMLGKISDACLVMGARVWFFLRPRPGELCSLAQNTVEDFFFRDGRLPADEEGFVRYAEVVVLLEDRRAVEVLRVGYFQDRTRADGTLDRERAMKVMGAAGEAAFGHLPFPKPPPGVIGAEHKFAQRRLDHLSRWKPTRAEVMKLRELVNRKAGREIM